jgi:hypothetical protein
MSTAVSDLQMFITLYTSERYHSLEASVSLDTTVASGGIISSRVVKPC